MTSSGPAVWRSRNVFFLGVVSLLTDASSEMIFPLLPLFLTRTLGAGAMALGLVEGVADASASLLRLASGALADRLGRHKPLVLAGYALSGIARPCLALAGTASHVLSLRVVDRVGKGLRGSPRDVLIAHAVPVRQRASAFGWHRSMDHAGAVIGPLIAWALLAFAAVELRSLFAWAALPAAMALACVVFGVREASATDAAPGPPSPDATPGPEPGAWTGRPAAVRLLAPFALFTLGRPSDAFLLLIVGAGDAPIESLPLIWVGCNALRMLAASPGGRLADRIGDRPVILAGWCGHVVASACLALGESQAATLFGIALVVTAEGAREGPEKALVSKLAPRRKHGTAFGVYHSTHGLLTLAASVCFGAMLEQFGRRAAFFACAVLAGWASLWLLRNLSYGDEEGR